MFYIPGRTKQNIASSATAIIPVGKEVLTGEEWRTTPDAEELQSGQNHHKPKSSSTVAFFIVLHQEDFKIWAKNLNSQLLYIGHG